MIIITYFPPAFEIAHVAMRSFNRVCAILALIFHFFECQYKMIERIAIAHIHYAFIILAFVFAAPSFKHRIKKKCCGHTVELLAAAI